MTVSIIIFLLFFLSLLVIPYGYAWFEPPKVICAQVLIEILLVIRFVHTKYLSFPLLILFLLTLFDLIFLRTPTTFWGNTFRSQGVFLLWHLLLFALISSQVRLPKIPFLVFLLPVLGLIMSGFILGTNQAGRVTGTLGEPNALAASGVFLFPFLLLATNRKSFKLGVFLLILWLILLSGSRAGLIALGIQSAFLLLTKLTKYPTIVCKSVFVCLVLLTLSLGLPFIENTGWYENRVEIWRTAITAGSLNPILGAGFGNTEQALSHTSQLLNNNLRFQYVDSSHNFLLDYWVQGGLVGVSLIVFLIYCTIRNFVGKKKKLELAALIGVITVMSFNPASVVTLIAFWFLIGQGFRDSFD